MLKYLGLLMVVASWIGGLFLVRKWPGTHVMSISQHAGSNKDASKLFAVILVVGGGAIYVWLVTWFIPFLNLSTTFTVLLTSTVALQIAAAIVPDSGSWKTIVHRCAAYTMAALYFPLSYLIVSASAISDTAKVVGSICLSYMVVALILFIAVKRARNRYLIFQSLYIVAFQVIILSAAYLSPHAA